MVSIEYCGGLHFLEFSADGLICTAVFSIKHWGFAVGFPFCMVYIYYCGVLCFLEFIADSFLLTEVFYISYWGFTLSNDVILG